MKRQTKRAEKGEENAQIRLNAIEASEKWNKKSKIYQLERREKAVKLIKYYQVLNLVKNWNEELYQSQVKDLGEEINISKKNYQDQSELLEREIENNENLKAEKASLQKELEEQKELFRKAQETIENQRIKEEELSNRFKKKEFEFNDLEKAHRATKSLPKRPRKIKLIKNKIKNKVWNLIKRQKSQKQKAETISQIAIRVI